MSCKRCQADPQHFGEPRRCAFDAEGAFTPDNWQCATLEVLLDKAQANHYGDDESVQLVPVVFFDENGLADGTDGWIVLTRYKSRGCTSSAIHVGDFWPPKPITLAMAEQQADFHESGFPDGLRQTLSEAARLLRCVRVLDCGEHYCRYCVAKSPEWNHGPHCPYVKSQQEYIEAQAVARTLEAWAKEESR